MFYLIESELFLRESSVILWIVKVCEFCIFDAEMQIKFLEDVPAKIVTQRDKLNPLYDKTFKRGETLKVKRIIDVCDFHDIETTEDSVIIGIRSRSFEKNLML